jgi:hypothetical protein
VSDDVDRQDAKTPRVEPEPALAPVRTAQVLAYLKASGQTLGLLINFDLALLKYGIKRVVLSPSPGALASWRSPSSKSDFPQA